MKYEKSVGGIVFREENGKKLFLLLHYQRMNDANGKHTYWDFPKGHVEEGETEVHTLLREVGEETGISELEVVEGFREKIKYFFNLKGELINKEVIFFLCRTETRDVKISKEHIGFAWKEFKDAVETLEFKNARDVLTKSKEFLSHRKRLVDW